MLFVLQSLSLLLCDKSIYLHYINEVQKLMKERKRKKERKKMKKEDEEERRCNDDFVGCSI